MTTRLAIAIMLVLSLSSPSWALESRGGGGIGPAGPSGPTGPAGPGLCTLAIPTVGTCANQAGVCAICNLSSAQIQALDTVPVTLIPPPGANKAILVSVAPTFESVFGSVAYGATGQGWGIYYNGSTAGTSSTDIVEAREGEAVQLAATTSYWNPVAIINGHGTPYVGNEGTAFSPTSVANKAVLVTVYSGGTYNVGAILTSSIASPGTLYLVGDTGRIIGSNNCADANYTVTTTDGGTGAVTGITVSPTGSCYSTVYNSFITDTNSAAGSGLTINVNSFGPVGDGTEIIYMPYNIVPIQ